MSSTSFSWERFRELPVIGILRGFSSGAVRELVRAARRGGLRAIEVTMNSPGAPDLIRIAAEEARGAMDVGAGTVLTLAGLEAALAAGAGFIVTPVVAPAVIEACRERGVPVIAGAFTPTEIHHAWSLGADLVKVFPAGRLGPGYLRDIKGPLPEVKLAPAGGITLESLPAYRRAGADAAGVGGPLFAPARVAAGDWKWIEEEARRFGEAWRAAGDA
jgi:2-dehydro-3-deoxyphosphogluconate aldolase/(4S)-4-hydroxy-2-oxoglutarate aldolase